MFIWNESAVGFHYSFAAHTHTHTHTQFAERNTLTDIAADAKTDQVLKVPAKLTETICRRQEGAQSTGNMACRMEQMAMESIPLALEIRICHLSLAEVLLAILQLFFFYSICHLRWRAVEKGVQR